MVCLGEDTKPHVLIEFLCKQPVSVIEQEFSSVTKKMGEFLQKELAEEEFPVKDINCTSHPHLQMRRHSTKDQSLWDSLSCQP